ncbi:MAG: molybdopterin-dependent oxidoreductase [Dehalococcoidia bacterium]|nr:MAG: molybdopterin-dependent oxidoreductase [Dehalococcoidia bacterium]
MSNGEKITLTINDKQVEGTEGDTILDICRANNIYVPTLCYLEGFSNVGACRLCVVEIEGERRINPACTYPARNGLVVRTKTDALEKYRRLILELIFTERNHFCFFCEASGDCELQALAYEYQVDHMRYPYNFPSLPVDTLNKFLVIDHNRCILCGRCVRVCGEGVANHTLDFGKRGWRTLVVADINQSIGESSCINCGACAQACPTGAIFSKISAYRGRTSEGKVVRSVCSQCGVGCPIDVLVKDNNIVRIDGTDLREPEGQLCAQGRFRQVYREGTRITTPLIHTRARGLQPSSWENALKLVGEKIKEYKGRYGTRSIAGLASSRCSNETLNGFAGLMRQIVGTSKVDTLDGECYRVLTKGISSFSKNGLGLEVESTLENILKADCVLVVGSNPLESHPVAGSYVLKARHQNNAQLIVIDSRANTFGFRADLRLRPKPGSEEVLFNALAKAVTRRAANVGKPHRNGSLAKTAETTGLDRAVIRQVIDKLSVAEKPVLIYGEGVINQKNTRIIARLLDLANVAGKDGINVISLKPRGNSRGAWDLGIASQKEVSKGKLVYMLVGDDEVDTDYWIDQLNQAEFVIIQASYHSPLIECADVVLPSPIWAEQQGSYVSLDGVKSQSKRILKPLRGIRSDSEIITRVAKKL